MKRRVLIEGFILLAIGMGSVAEALRLIVYKVPGVLYDALGPGFYLLIIGTCLLITGASHLLHNYHEYNTEKVVTADEKMRTRMIATVLICGIYAILIDYVGYLLATVFFFVAEFRLFGVKSLLANIALSLLLTATNYILFVKLCGLIFPEGVF